MIVKYIECYRCKKRFPSDTIIFQCDKCGCSLDLIYDYNKIKEHILHESFKKGEIRHWKYWPFYPIEHLDKVITMNEGGTPLLESNKQKGLFFKYEGVNPTCSFKDRGTTVEISRVRELGIKEVACASTGNMGASVAAYSARAGIKATIYVPTFASLSKLKQIVSYGAGLVRVKGTYEDTLNKTKELREKTGVYLTGDYPYRGEGEKSVGFEIIDQMDWKVPDYIVCPMGNGTLIYGIYKGLVEFKKTGLIKKIPRIIGVQAKGCNPIVEAFKMKKREFTAVKKPKTEAGAIACGNPVDGFEALDSLYSTKGLAVDVTDKEMSLAKKELGKEGIYAELSGAASFAAVKKLNIKGPIVCVVTGHGLKDAGKL
jgi:threonine synthase